MKKLLIGIISLVVLAAASITAFIIVKNKQDKIAEESAELAADYALFTFDSDSINKVTFDFGDGIYVAEFSEEREWELTSTDEFFANHSYVQNVCSYMSTLTAEKDYGEADDEKKALYGLENPVTVTASDGKNEYTVYVGDPSPTGELYYIMTNNRSKIYSIDSLYGSVLKTSRTMLKDTALLPYKDNEIAEIKLIRDGKTAYELKLNEETGQWALPDDYKHLTTDVTNITSMINVLTRADAQNFFEEQLQDYSAYGFDDPVAELIVTGKDGSTRKLLFSYFGNNTETYTHVLFTESGQVATFYTIDVDFIEYTPATFISEYICNISISNITGFDYTYNGKTDEFRIDSEGIIDVNNLSVSGFGSEAAAEFTNLYNSLMYLKFESVDISIKPEYSEPILSINYHLNNDKGDRLLEFIEADSDSCYVFIDGTFTGALISKSSITGKNTAPYFYEKLMDIIGG